MDRNTLLDLIPAYALGALDPDERVEVETSLSADPEAQRLLAEYQEVADLLALTTPARRAPATLGDDLRRRLKAESPPAVRRSRRILRPAWLIPLAVAAALVIVVLGALLRSRTTDPAQLYAQIAAAPDSQHFAVVPDQNGSPIGGELVATGDQKQAVLQSRRSCTWRSFPSLRTIRRSSYGW